MFKIVYLAVVILSCSVCLVAQTSITVTSAEATLRGTPNAKGKIISTVKQDEAVELILQRGEWHLIQAKEYVGWIQASAVSAGRFAGFSNGIGSGGGQGSGRGTGQGSSGSNTSVITKPLLLISKPRPPYTEAAKNNDVQGTVMLRVTFLASGEIGSISVVKGLPYGLTEQAIAAARRIRFEPAEASGVPTTVAKMIEYTFIP